LTCDAELQLMG